MMINKKMLTRIMMMAILVTGLLFVSAIPAMASDAFYLFVMNGSKAVPAKIIFTVGGCYLGGTGNGQNLNLAPGKADRIHVYRDQGSSCDGEFGYFTLTMTPTAGKGNATQNFLFTNSGELSFSNTANAYPGKLGKPDSKFCAGKDDCDPARDYLYTTSNAPDKIGAGISVGEWVYLCGRFDCEANAFETQISSQDGKSKTVEDTDRQALKLSYEAGIELKGLSAKASVEGEFEKSHSESMSSSIMTMESNSSKLNVSIYTMAFMKKNGFKAIFQWHVKTPYTNALGETKIIDVKTHHLTCGYDATPPKFYPGSNSHLNACEEKSSN